MAGLTKIEALAQVRYQLKDIAGGIWDDDALGAYYDTVLKEISKVAPLEKAVALAIIDDTCDVDISVLIDVVEVLAVETPGGNVPPDFRNWKTRGDVLTVTLDAAPSVTKSTLTGTLTFTSGSKTISGVSTKFQDEVSVGDYVCCSTETKWYRVGSVASNTQVSLAEAYVGTTGADTENASLQRTAESIVVVHYGTLHTVDESSSSLTGTLTFTSDDQAVSGTSTEFEDEVSIGDYIRRSTETKWYKVEGVASDTALTLVEPYVGTTGNDSANASLVRTVDAPSSLPAAHDALLIEGILAYAAMSESMKTTNKVNIGDNAVAEYFRWAQQRLALYRSDLQGIEPIRIGQTYPLD